ncbi:MULTISPECIES: exopolysaccharide biosynthesis protein [unclassified Neochlamydia]|uniref:exopolysaccharide biosynthesis protein n=1 Tax=unclassified Neochlamydia TaxID=2643326 RepID=UPI00140A17F3|nr:MULTISPECIES: exopolysaccharide biosynthesis protein [unclassified Neochlamydia]
MLKKCSSLAEKLEHLLNQTHSEELSVQKIMDHLADQGYATLLIVLSLPFCSPMQIPGLSTLLGLLILLIGLRIAFGDKVWLPKRLLQKKIPFLFVKKVMFYVLKIDTKLGFLISTRWIGLVKNRYLHIIHGLTIAILAFFLSLPLPIPLTNLLAALPLLAFGLAFLEDDGFFILIAYFFAFICLLSFAAIIWFGIDWLIVWKKYIF